MAYRIDASTKFLSSPSTFPTVNAFAVSLWFYMDVDRNAAGVLFAMLNATGTVFQGLYLRATGTTLAIDVNGGIVGGSELATGQWYHLFYQRVGNDHTAYINGVLDITNTGNPALTTAFVVLGSNSVSFIDGRIGVVKMWSGIGAAFTAAEIVAEIRTIRPVRTANIHAWHPTFASAGTQDYSGTGHTLTVNGSAAAIDNPPVSWGAGPLLLPYAASGGTTYPLVISGSITPTGTLVKTPRKLLAGGVTPSGALINRSTKVLSGAVSSIVGALVRSPKKLLSGEITPSGALTANRLAVLTITGAVSSIVGVLVKTPRKLLAGGMTPSGSLINQPRKILIGSVTPSGALATVKVAILTLSGSVSSSGTLVKRAYKSLTGTMSSISGVLVNRPNKLFSGSISSISGTLMKTPRKLLGGGITPAGTLSNSRLAILTLSGVVSSVGGFQKTIVKRLSGTVESTGSLVKIPRKIFNGVVSLVGQLVTDAGAVTIVLPITGTLMDVAVYTAVLVASAAYRADLNHSAAYRGELSDE